MIDFRAHRLVLCGSAVVKNGLDARLVFVAVAYMRWFIDSDDDFVSSTRVYHDTCVHWSGADFMRVGYFRRGVRVG